MRPDITLRRCVLWRHRRQPASVPAPLPQPPACPLPSPAPVLPAHVFIQYRPALPLPAHVFIPTPFQQDILVALKGKGLRTDALVAKLDCGRSRLYAKTGGLPELQEQGLVAHHKRLGYYRPDALPPEAQEYAA